jgi:Arc/MetJ-type ribon-helix-helix transcriptional regulator
MAFALAREQIAFIQRMIRSGRYNSQSEVVRAALRRLEDEESEYLTPPVLTPAQIDRIYGTNRRDDARERRFGKAAFAAVRRAARKGRRA